MKAYILAALLLPACSAPNYILIDQRFTTEEESLIREAATNWQVATDRRIDLVFGQRVDTDTTSNTSSLVRVMSRNPALDTPKDGAEVDTWYFGNKRIMLVVDQMHNDAERVGFSYNAVFLHTAQHELGHWLGVQYHIENSTTAVMRAGIRRGELPATCVTALDASAFCANTDGCRQDQMKGCPQ